MSVTMLFLFALFLMDPGVAAWSLGSGVALFPNTASSSGGFLLTVDNSFSTADFDQVEQSGKVECAFSKTDKYEFLILGAVTLTPAVWLRTSNRLFCIAPTFLTVGNLYVAIYFDGQAKDLGLSISIYAFLYANPLSAPLSTAEERSTTIRFALYMYPRTAVQRISCLFSGHLDTPISNSPYVVWPLVGPSSSQYILTIHAPPGHPWPSLLAAPVCVFVGANYQSGGIPAVQGVLARIIQCPVPLDAPVDFEVTFNDQSNPSTPFRLGTTSGKIAARKSIFFVSVASVLSSSASSTEFVCTIPLLSQPQNVFFEYAPTSTPELAYSLASAGQKYIQYYSAPSFAGLSNSIGHFSGGLSLTIHGANFVYTLGMSCRFHNTISSAVFLSSTQIVCVTPFFCPRLDDNSATLGHDWRKCVNFDTTIMTLCKDSYASCNDLFLPVPFINVSVSLYFSGNGINFVSANLKYLYIPEPKILSISPNRGPTEGEITITIRGYGFPSLGNAPFNGQVVCKFFNSLVVPGILVDSTKMLCTAPPASLNPSGSGIFETDLAISFNRETFVTSAVVFKYFSVSSISPSLGPSVGNTAVAIKGVNIFLSPTDTQIYSPKCRFSNLILGDFFVSIIFGSNEVATCFTPAVLQPLKFNISVLLISGQGTSVYFEYQYAEEAKVFTLQPRYGPRNGGYFLLVLGADFVSNPLLSCRVQDNNSAIVTDLVSGGVVFINSSAILCRVPYSSIAKDVRLDVSPNRQQYSSTSLVFSYFAMEKFSPLGGIVNGGTVLNVEVKNFSPTQAYCKFGQGYSETLLRDENNNTLVIPASTGISIGFQFSIMGNQSNVIRFSCRTTAQLAASEKMPMSISYDGINFATGEESTFYFYNDPQIKVLSTNVMPIQGKTPITITGQPHPKTSTGLGANSIITCKWGDLGVSIAKYIKSDSILCFSPPASDNLVSWVIGSTNGSSKTYLNLTISFNEADYNSVPFPVYYYNNNLVLPSLVDHMGGTIIYLTGVNYNLAAGTEVGCLFWLDIFVSGIFDELTSTIECEVPPQPSDLGSDYLPVRSSLIANVANQYSQTRLGVVYFKKPILSFSFPTFATRTTPSEVVILGSGFINHPNMRCRFGRNLFEKIADSKFLVLGKLPNNPSQHILAESFTVAKFINISAIVCNTSIQTLISKQDILLSYNFQQYSVSKDGFFFYGVSSIFPRAASLAGGSIISVSGNFFLSNPKYMDSTVAFPDKPAILCIWRRLNGSNSYETYFESNAMTTFRLNTNVQCILPPSKDSMKESVYLDISISAGVDATFDRNVLSYFDEANVSSTLPSIGFLSGGTVIAVSGYGFVQSPDLSCTFSTSNLPVITTVAIFQSSVLLTCTAPQFPVTGDWTLDVSLNKVTYVPSIARAYKVYPIPFATNFYPFSIARNSTSRIFMFLSISNVPPGSVPFIKYVSTIIPCTTVVESSGLLGLISSLNATIPSEPFLNEGRINISFSLDGSSTFFETPFHIYVYKFLSFLPGTSMISTRTFFEGVGVFLSQERFARIFFKQINGTYAFNVYAPVICNGVTMICTFNGTFPVMPSQNVGSYAISVAPESPTSIFPSTTDFLTMNIIPDVSLSSLTPRYGVSNQVFVISLVGSNFPARESFTPTCLLAGHRSVSTSILSTNGAVNGFTCVFSAISDSIGTFPVLFSINSRDFVQSGLFFAIYVSPVITHLIPEMVPMHLSVPITILGLNFRSDLEQPQALIGGDMRVVLYVNSTLMIMNSPVHVVPTRLGLRITIDNNLFSNSLALSLISLSRISPSLGSVFGKTNVCALFEPSVVNSSGSWLSPSCKFSSYAQNVVPIIVPGILSASCGGVICQTPNTSAMNSSAYEMIYMEASLSDQTFATVTPGVQSASAQNPLNLLPFMYVLDPIVEKIFPSFVSATGGATISVWGSNFLINGLLSCQFHPDITQQIAAEPRNTSFLTCVFPTVCFSGTRMTACLSKRRLSSNSTFSAKVAVNNQEWGPIGARIFPHTIVGFDPNGGLRQGGAIVNISGINLMHGYDYSCRFKTVIVPAILHILSGTVSCTSPQYSDADETLELCLSPRSICFTNAVNPLNHHYFTDERITFKYYSSAPILSFKPDSVSPYGNLDIRISLVETASLNLFSAYSKSARISCRFGTVIVVGQLVNSKLIICKAPENQPGASNLDISLNDQQFSESFASFFYFLPERTEPFGANFEPCVESSSQSLRCFLSLGYSLKSVHPFEQDSQSNSYGITLQIYGKGFSFSERSIAPNALATQPRCLFGDFSDNGRFSTIVFGTFQADLSIMCRSPGLLPSNVSTVPVAVNLNGIDGVKSSRFPFGDQWASAESSALGWRSSARLNIISNVLTSLSPSIETASGGWLTTLRGENFVNSGGIEKCRFVFAGIPTPTIVPATVTSSTTMVCRVAAVPQIAKGVVNEATIEFSFNGVQFLTCSRCSSSGVSKVLYLSINFILPSISPISASGLVTLIGVNFEQTVCLCTICNCASGVTALAQAFPSSYPAFIGNISTRIEVRVLANNKDVVLIINPHSSGALAGLHTLNTSFGQTDIVVGNVFLFNDITFTAYYPRSGPEDGSTIVTLFGINILNRPELQCFFGNTFVAATFVDQNSVSCVSPPIVTSTATQVAIGLAVLDSQCPPGSTAAILCPARFSRFDCLKAPVPCFPGKFTCSLASSRNFGQSEFSGAVTCSTASSNFMYWKVPRILSLLPPSGPAAGATAIIVSETEAFSRVKDEPFMSSLDPYCAVGSDMVRGIFQQISGIVQIKCLTEAGLKPGFQFLTVSLNNQQFTAPLKVFVVYPDLKIMQVIPSRMITNLITPITIVGQNFQRTDIALGLVVKQGSLTPQTALFVSQNIAVITQFNPGPRVGQIDLQLSLNNENFVGPVTFEVISPVATTTSCPFDCNGHGLCEQTCRCEQPYSGIDCSYTYAITSMVPCSGPQYGGTSVTILGFRFDKASFSENNNFFETRLNVMCRFGTIIVPGNVTTSGLVTCVSPPFFYNGSVTVDVTLFGDSFWTTNGAYFLFHYYMEPSLFSVSPSVIPQSGGSTLVIKSAHNHSFMSSPRDTPRCLSDPSCKHLLMQQQIGLACVFNSQFQLSLKSPSINYNSISELSCSTPSFDIGASVSQATVSLFITLNGQQVSHNSLELLIYKNPEVHSIFPEVGSWSSSIAVTLLGTGFFQSSLKQCAFDGRISSSFQILSPTTAVCYSSVFSLLPPFLVKNAFLPSQISFTMNGKTFSIINSTFSFIKTWRITSLTPSLGPEGGGTRVIISGFDIMYTKTIKCKFGLLPSPEPPCCLSSASGGSCSTTLGSTCSLLLCKSPPNRIPRPAFATKNDYCAGNRLYGLTRDLCLPTDYSCSFQVLDPTTKSMLCSSNSGSAAIIGADGAIVSPAFLPSANEILHPDIPLRVGTPLYLSLDGQNYESLDSPFVYHETVNITALIPDIAPASKTSVITVLGDGFQKVDSGGNQTAAMLLCKFGSLKYLDISGNEADSVGQYVDPHTILCRTSSAVTLQDTAGNILSQQDAFVEISLNGNQYSDSKVKINFVRLWSITSIHPEVGSITGGMMVTLTGPYFRATSVMKCLFGSQSSTYISVLSQTVIICRAPSYTTCGDTNVSLTLDGSTYSAIIPKKQGVQNLHTVFRFQGVPFMELFGNNDFGQLGYGDKLKKISPQPNRFFDNLKISQVAMGQAHTLVISGISYGDKLGTVPKDGVLYSMGTNFVGQLGVGDTIERLTPTIVPCNGEKCYSNVSGSETSVYVNPFWTRKITFVACGSFHSLAISNDDSIWAWGWNNKGQLGFGIGYLEPFSLYPLAISFFDDNKMSFSIIRIAAGFTHSAAVSSLGQVYVWGDNRKGQLGLGDFSDRSLPTLLSNFFSDKESPVFIVDVACGSYFSAAITRMGEIHVWGSNRKGQLGSCASVVTKQPNGLKTCKPIATQSESETIQIPYPVKVMLLSDQKATSLTTGASFVIVSFDNGDIYLWGENSFGQLSMCERSAAGCIAAYGDTSYKRIPTLGRVPFYTIGSQCTNLNFQNCLDASTYLVKRRSIMTSAGGAEHSVFIFQDTEPIGKGGAFLSRRSIAVSGRNHFGQLGLGNGIELSGLAIEHPKRLSNLLKVSAAYHQSSYVMSCPIDSATKAFCSDNGVCSETGFCICDQGFRGFDCSFQCAGGAVNPCSLRGDGNEARQVSLFARQQVTSMYGLQIYQLLNDLVVQLPLKDGLYSSLHYDMLMKLIVQYYPLFQKFVDGYKFEHPTGKRRCFLPNTMTDQSCLYSEIEDIRSELFDDIKFASYIGIRTDVFSNVKKNLFVECPICSLSEISYNLETTTGILVSVKNMYKAGTPQMVANLLCTTLFPQSSECPVSTKLVNALYSARMDCSQCNMTVFDRGCLFDGSCVCANGFAGASCNTACRGPIGKPCNLHGRCTSEGGCDCDNGYVGLECEVVCRGLTTTFKICSGQGSCVTGKELAFQAGGNQFIQPPIIPWTQPTLTQLVMGDCSCNAGFVGEDCSKACPGGPQQTCNSRGICSIRPGSTRSINATCACAGQGLAGSGFFGDACEFVCPGTYMLGEPPPNGEKGLNACFMHGVCDMSAAGQAKAYQNLYKQQTFIFSNSTNSNSTNSTNVTSSQGSIGPVSNILYVTCTCFEGYKGAACNIECRGGYKNPCSRNGLCLDNGECDCNNGGTKDLGWRGRNCSIPCDGGPSTICSLHGTCDSKGKCACLPGFRAFDCSIECKGGADNVCSAKGVCDETGGCSCTEGYRGEACEKNCPGLKEESICSARGICDDDAVCKCQALYEGENCEKYAIWFFVVISLIFIVVAPLTFVGVKKMHRERVKHVRRLRRDKRKVRHSAAVAIRVKRYQRNDANQHPQAPSDSSIAKPPSGEAQGVRRPVPRALAVHVTTASAVSDIDESEDEARVLAIASAAVVPSAPQGSPQKIVRRAKATIVAKEHDSDN